MTGQSPPRIGFETGHTYSLSNMGQVCNFFQLASELVSQPRPLTLLPAQWTQLAALFEAAERGNTLATSNAAPLKPIPPGSASRWIDFLMS